MSETTSEPKAITVTVATLPASAAERYGERVAARYKVDDEWREHDLRARSAGPSTRSPWGWSSSGSTPAIGWASSPTRALEWTLASYGISAAGAVVVPVYPTNSPRECEWVLGNSGARAVFCEDAEPAGQDRAGARRAAGAEPLIGIEAGRRGDLRSTSCASAARRRDRAELADAPGGGRAR